MANITNAQVRERLRTLNSTVEVPEAILTSLAYVTAGDSWLAVMLANSGFLLASLDSNEQTLAKAAEIAFVAAKVIASAPLNDNEKGPIKIKAIKSADIKTMVDILEKEWKDYLELIGCEISVTFCSSFGIDTLD